jgi:hypothetical protein
VLLEALVAAGFFALAIPFGYLSRIVKRSSLDAYRKWPLFLGVVHTPVVPLIAYVNLVEVTLESELLLVAVVLSGHATGVLVHRQRAALLARAAAPAAAGADK